ncbi:MAG: hypothetical protein ACK2UB_07490, partial [Anaerolineales bacterium]
MEHLPYKPSPTFRFIPSSRRPAANFPFRILLPGDRFSIRRILYTILIVVFFALAAGDSGDDNPGDGYCRTALVAPNCTLRAALEEVNAPAGPQSIHFDLPDPAISIRPHSALPVISGEPFIDGTTQPGYTLEPIMVIDGSLPAAPLISGLETATGSDVTLRGLSVMPFPLHGIHAKGDLHVDHIFSWVNARSGRDIAGAPGTADAVIENSDFSDNIR